MITYNYRSLPAGCVGGGGGGEGHAVIGVDVDGSLCSDLATAWNPLAAIVGSVSRRTDSVLLSERYTISLFVDTDRECVTNSVLLWTIPPLYTDNWS